MKMRLAFVIVVLIFQQGCTSLERQIYSGYAAPPLDSGSLDRAVALAKALQAVDASGSPLVPSKCFGVAISGGDVSTCSAARNQAAAVMIIASTDLCTLHRQTIYGRDAASNISFGTLTNLFSGAAAVASTESAKTLYAALALFSNSERSLINETVYKQTVVTAVNRKIGQAMLVKSQQLDQSLALDINQFSMYKTVQAVLEVHKTCSFMTGLELVLEEGTQNSATQRRMELEKDLAAADLRVKANCSAALATSVQCVEGKKFYEAVAESLKVMAVSGK